jgi:uncharacterized membrane protein YdjX (TVP38/TMEM64 family)
VSGEYLILVAVVFGVNLLPAFGPPTWAVLVFFRVNEHLAPVPLVLLGALAAASGRLVLAVASRHFRGRLPERYVDNLDAAQGALIGDRRAAVAGLALFALSPVPSAQLFVAAGLLQVRLLPLTAAFFAGRIVSYSLYVAAASAVSASLGDVLGDALGSPLGIVVQVLFLAALVALVRVDWAGVIARRSNRQQGREQQHRRAPGGDPGEAEAPRSAGERSGQQVDRDQGEHGARGERE